MARRWQGLEGQSRARGLEGRTFVFKSVERRREHLDGGYVFDYPSHGALRRLAQRLQPHQTNAGAAATSATASTKHLLSRVASGAPFLQARNGRTPLPCAAIAKKQIRRLLTNATPRYDGRCAAAARPDRAEEPDSRALHSRRQHADDRGAGDIPTYPPPQSRHSRSVSPRSKSRG